MGGLEGFDKLAEEALTRAAVLGWYGHGNLGDEAMLEALKILLKRHLNIADFEVMSNTTMPQITIRAANECDLFVLGGGELINADRLFLAGCDGWAEHIKVPKIIVGCGVNTESFDSIQDHVIVSLSGFEYIGLRDSAAVEMLSQSGMLARKVRLTLDPSLILADEYGIEWKPKVHVAAIVPTDRRADMLVHDGGVITSGVMEQTKTILKQELEADGIEHARLLAFGGDDNDDMLTCSQLHEYLNEQMGSNHAEIIRPNDAKHALELLSGCERAYTYRLHGLLLAYSLAIPHTCFGYHRKIKRNADTLRHVSPQAAVDLIHKAFVELAETVQLA